MAMGRDHNASMGVEMICRRIFAKGKDLHEVDRSVVGSSMDADSIDYGGLKQALCVAFSPHFHDLPSKQWGEVETLLDKYTSSLGELEDGNRERYTQMCKNAEADAEKLAKLLNLIK